MIRVLGGRYRLIEELGSGGMSVVWRAYDEVLGRQVAVKVLPPGGPADDGSRNRILAEAQQVARLAHPYITSVHDYGESPIDEDGESVPFVVMELVTGPTLADRIEAGPLPVAESLRVCAQVAAALAAAHARGVVHRDIKPSNIMLSPSGAKVLDFGIAAVAGEADSAPANGQVWGTPAYLAPERLEDGSVVPASDVYALGLLLYRLLAGELPWRAETVTEMIEAHRYMAPAPLPYLPGIHDSVREICARCLAKDPAERPAAGEVARRLAAATGRHSRAVATAVGRAGPFAPMDPVDPDAETRVVPMVKYRNARSTGPVVVRPPDSAGVLAEEYRMADAEPGETDDDHEDADEDPDEDGDLPLPVEESGVVGGEPASAGVVGAEPARAGVVGAEPASAARSERGAAVAALRVPSGAVRPRPAWRRTALAGAAVLVAVGLLVGHCAAGDPARDGPRAGVSVPAGGVGSRSGDPTASASAAQAGSGATPGSPIQPDATGGNPATGDGPGPTGVPGPGPGTTPAPAPPPVERTFDTAGGTVTARCAGPTATLVGWNPLPGFAPSLVDRGPGPQVGLTLSAVVTTVRVGVSCDGGVPVASIG